MFTEKELSVLLGEVEKEFSSYLTKAEETVLAKSEEADSKPEEKKEENKEEKPEAKEDNKEEKPEQKEQAAASENKDEAPAATSEEAPAQADAAAQADGHGYDDEDMAHMDAMYASMSKAELIAHHDSVKRALDAMSAQEAPAAPAAAAPEMDKCGDMNMAKSEQDQAVEVKPEVITSNEETELLKSEVAAKDGKIQELQKTLEAVTAFVTKLVEKKGAPQGKAITQLDTIAKSETEQEEKQLTKKEITTILTQKASDNKLAKTDREAINAYYATGQININGISHLLK